MKQKTKFKNEYSDLRKRAQEVFQKIEKQNHDDSDYDYKSLIEELKINQIELEIQNEELQEVRDRLEESGKYLNDLFHYAPVGYIVLNSKGEIQDINNTASEYFGYKKEGLTGQRLLSTLPPDNFLEYSACIKDVMEYKTPQRAEIQFRNKNGKNFWARMDLIILPCEKEPVILCSLLDITREKKAEQSLRDFNAKLEGIVENRTKEMKKALARAEKANEAKKSFLANISHELRTPLSGINGMVQMVKMTPLNQEQEEYINTIDEATRSLLVIINDLLDLSKIEAGKIDLKPELFDVSVIIDKEIHAFSLEAERKNIGLKKIIPEEIPGFVYGDPARLRQVLRNLIKNALKFTPDGFVTVGVYLEEENESAVRLCFYIRDTGIGIPPEQRDKLFQAFSQIDNPEYVNREGTGLGLAISRQLVELMGGDIGVNSERHKGSEFFFTLSFDKAKENNISDSSVTVEKTDFDNISSLRILLAEDNLFNQKFISRLLKKQGHEITIAENGKEVLSAIETDTFDLVLMDIQMPEMDGIEATRYIRQADDRHPNKNVPIIALTAYSMKGDRERFIDSGMNDYISKPVNIQDLKKVIAKIMLTQKP